MRVKNTFLILCLLPLFIILTACGGSQFVQQIPDNIIPNELYLNSKTIEMGENQFKTDEGFIVVFENPADDQSNKIALPVLRIRSTSDNPKEPVFWLGGGPGQSNMDYRPFTEMLSKHDFILVGYRGIDGSIKMKSHVVERALEYTDGDLLSSESLGRLSETLESLSNKLKEQNVDLSHYTIVDVISDFETVRKAFEYKRINLLSASYGTRVAQIYGYRHPGNIFRSVMISVNPPGHFIWYPQKIDDQLAYYDSLFAADPAHYDGRSLSRSIKTALKNMPSRWTVFKLDPGKIRSVAFAMLYSKNSAPIVFQCFRAAEEGDYSGLYALQRMYDLIFPDMLAWGDLLAKGGTDFDLSTDYEQILNDTTTVMGSPFSLLITGGAIGHWPIHKIPEEYSKVQTSDVHTLLIGGSVDFSTPAEYATKELLPYLPNGKQIILKEMGHVQDIFSLQHNAFVNLLTRYYDEGVVDDSKYVYDPVNFEAPMNIPLWTKILYPFVLLSYLF